MKNRINQIITLNDNSKFIIIDQGNYNDKSYYLSALLDEDENITNKFTILEAKIVNDEEIVNTLDNEELLKALSNYFQNRINK